MGLRLLARGSARVGQRREVALELRAQMLVLVGEPQLFPKMLRGLVDGKARRGRRDLEQDALGLAEVDGQEVVAVDDGGDMHAGLGDALLPGNVVFIPRVPGDVVNGAGAL